MHAYARSISTIWLMNTLVSAVGFILIISIRAYSLHRTVIREGAEKSNDPEKGEELKKATGEAGSIEVKEAPTKDNSAERPPSSLGGETARDQTDA